MGCDIHMYVEHKDENGRWWKVNYGLQSDLYDANDKYFSNDKFRDEDKVYDSRNYLFFAYLADVRNGIGFAGCDTGDRIKPMAKPKGLPKDVSLTIKDMFEEWGNDAHTPSYFSLKELKIGYEKAKKMIKIHRGYVTIDEYKDYLKNGYPNSWCGDTSGEKISNKNMREIIKLNKRSGEYTQIEWKTNLAEDLKRPFEHIIRQLSKWNPQLNDEEIRIVFWFDN